MPLFNFIFRGRFCTRRCAFRRRVCGLVKHFAQTGGGGFMCRRAVSVIVSVIGAVIVSVIGAFVMRTLFITRAITRTTGFFATLLAVSARPCAKTPPARIYERGNPVLIDQSLALGSRQEQTEMVKAEQPALLGARCFRLG